MAKFSPTHGHATGKKSKTYRAWAAMKERCCKPHHPAYANYGGRGITVCAQWLQFAGFLADMGEKPADRSLDRIDNTKGYSPDNCRWATRKEQERNKRSSVRVTALGETLTLAEWAERTGIQGQTIAYRVRNGWSPDLAVTKGAKPPLVAD